jgi:hypothetical protein
MKKILFLTLPILFFSQKSDAAEKVYKSRTSTCHVMFDHNSSQVNEESLNSCIKNLDLANLHYINIYGTSTPDGGVEYNQKLSEDRSQNLKNALKRFHVPIQTFNGGSSINYDKKGTITFIILNQDRDENSQNNCKSPILTPEVKPQITDRSNYKNSIYFGAGITSITGSLADYTGSTGMTYNVGINYVVSRFSLIGGLSQFYLGGDLSFSILKNNMNAPDSNSSAYDVNYVRNNYALIFGIERALFSTDVLSAFVEAGPAFQERYIVLNSAGSVKNSLDNRNVGLNSNAGFKISFLNNSKSLENLGFNKLFVKINGGLTYGPQAKVLLTYKTNGEEVDINSIAWSAVASFGASF